MLIIKLIAPFTVINGNKAGVDFVLIQPPLQSHVNYVVLMLIAHNFRTKTEEVCIKTIFAQGQPHIHSRAIGY